MATTKTELYNNGTLVATKTSAPFNTFDWTPASGEVGSASLTVKRYEDGVLVATSAAVGGTVDAAASSQVSYTMDDYTGAVIGYSLNKLRSAYNGSAIRVRRSNDNAQQDIGFDSDGRLDTAALSSFVDVNDGYVVTWYDQSTTGRNATNTLVAEQPKIVNAGTIYTLNGFPTVLFNQKYLKYTTNTDLVNQTNGSWSSFGYGQFNAQGNNYMFSHDSNVSPRVAQFLKVSATQDSAETISFETGGAAIIDSSPVSVSYIGSPVYISAINTGTTVESFMNGAGNGSQAISTPRKDSSTFDIGARGKNSPETGTNVYISTIIHYNSDQSVNRSNIESSINNNHI
jgi:hypothetical protein